LHFHLISANLYSQYSDEIRAIIRKASAYQYCELPKCSENIDLDIRGIMRRVTVGNFTGAKKLANKFLPKEGSGKILSNCETKCIQNIKHGSPVEIKAVIEYITK